LLGGFLARAGQKPDEIQQLVEIVAREGGCKPRDAKKHGNSAKDSADNTLNGDKTYGLKTLREKLGDKIADALAIGHRQSQQARI